MLVNLGEVDVELFQCRGKRIIWSGKLDQNNFSSKLNKLKGGTTYDFRKRMACKAFGLTAYYDAIVSEWFNRDAGLEFPERKTFFGKKIGELRYGENPHQQSSIYVNDYNDKNLNELDKNSKKWSNYSTIVTWYLWSSYDSEPLYL